MNFSKILLYITIPLSLIFLLTKLYIYAILILLVYILFLKIDAKNKYSILKLEYIFIYLFLIILGFSWYTAREKVMKKAMEFELQLELKKEYNLDKCDDFKDEIYDDTSDVVNKATEYYLYTQKYKYDARKSFVDDYNMAVKELGNPNLKIELNDLYKPTPLLRFEFKNKVKCVLNFTDKDNVCSIWRNDIRKYSNKSYLYINYLSIPKFVDNENIFKASLSACIYSSLKDITIKDANEFSEMFIEEVKKNQDIKYEKVFNNCRFSAIKNRIEKGDLYVYFEMLQKNPVTINTIEGKILVNSMYFNLNGLIDRYNTIWGDNKHEMVESREIDEDGLQILNNKIITDIYNRQISINLQSTYGKYKYKLVLEYSPYDNNICKVLFETNTANFENDYEGYKYFFSDIAKSITDYYNGIYNYPNTEDEFPILTESEINNTINDLVEEAIAYGKGQRKLARYTYHAYFDNSTKNLVIEVYYPYVQ